MPRILDNGKLRVYVYANDDNPHHLPHCQVYWNGDDHASVVSLPDLMVIAGEALSRAARAASFERTSISSWRPGSG